MDVLTAIREPLTKSLRVILLIIGFPLMRSGGQHIEER